MKEIVIWGYNNKKSETDVLIWFHQGEKIKSEKPQPHNVNMQIRFNSWDHLGEHVSYWMDSLMFILFIK